MHTIKYPLPTALTQEQSNSNFKICTVDSVNQLSTIKHSKSRGLLVKLPLHSSSALLFFFFSPPFPSSTARRCRDPGPPLQYPAVRMSTTATSRRLSSAAATAKRPAVPEGPAGPKAAAAAQAKKRVALGNLTNVTVAEGRAVGNGKVVATAGNAVRMDDSHPDREGSIVGGIFWAFSFLVSEILDFATVRNGAAREVTGSNPCSFLFLHGSSWLFYPLLGWIEISSVSWSGGIRDVKMWRKSFCYDLF
jgi:hypothetical protein